MAYTIDITKEFRFDAAHCLTTMPEGHPYTRLHGHSFRVEVTVAGTPDPVHGWVTDFTTLETALSALRQELDHQTLNDVAGLEQPTLERIGQWIFEKLAAQTAGIRQISVHRDSIGEHCTVRAEV